MFFFEMKSLLFHYCMNFKYNSGLIHWVQCSVSSDIRSYHFINYMCFFEMKNLLFKLITAWPLNVTVVWLIGFNIVCLEICCLSFSNYYHLLLHMIIRYIMVAYSVVLLLFALSYFLLHLLYYITFYIYSPIFVRH